ncbi:XrtA/PEP-CTERM system TPR-repeat protein PrsT [Colwelliaceae bacterium MEBiC 14330]
MYLLHIHLTRLAKVILMSMCLTFTLPAVSFEAVNHNVHYEKAMINFHDNQYDIAYVHLKNALKQHSDHLPSRILMAKILLAQNKGADAEIEIQKVLGKGADDIHTVPIFIKALLLQKKYKELLNFIDDNFYSASVIDSINLGRAQALLGNKQFHKADIAFKEVLIEQPDNVTALLGRAQIALKGGKLENAFNFSAKALTLEPDNISALLLTASLNQMKGNLEQALKTIEYALTIKPSNAATRLIYSILLMEQGQIQAAKTEIDKVLLSLPNEPGANFIKYLSNVYLGKTNESKETLANLVSIFDTIPDNIKQDFPIFYYLASLVDFQQENYNKARISMAAYLQLNDKDIKAQILSAKIAIAQEDLSHAKATLNKLTIYHSNNTEILSLLADVYLKMGDFEQAEYYFQELRRKKPNDINILTSLSKLQMIKSDFYPVIDNLKDHQQINDSPSALILLSKAYLAIKSPEMAITYLDILQKINPNSSYIYQLKGSALGMLNDIKGAKLNLTKALELSPENYQAIIQLAKIDFFENNVKSAVDKLSNHIKQYQPNSEILIVLADFYLADKKFSQAQKYYLKALLTNPKSISALTQLVTLYQQTNELDKAIHVTEKFILNARNIAEAYSLLGKLYFANRENDKADYAYKKAIKVSDKKEIALFELANFQLHSLKMNAAKKTLLKALTINEKHIPSQLKLIEIATQQKEKNYVLGLIAEFEMFTNNKLKANQLKGDIYRVTGEIKKAEYFYLLSLKERPTQQSIIGLYHLYKQLNRNDDIIKLLTNWLQQHPKDLITSIAFAETHKNLGNFKFALSYYKNLIEYYPNNPVLLNNTAMILLSLEYYQEATVLAHQAYVLMPNNANILDTKAWIETKKGNYLEALSLLRQANAMADDNVVVKYHLAITLDKLNRRNEGFSHLKDAALHKKHYPEKTKVVKLFNQWKLEKTKA